MSCKKSTDCPRLLFFPGWGFDRRIGDLLPCLQDHKWLAVAGFSRPDMVAASHDLLLAEGHGPVHLVGWSMGANLASDFASQFPEDVLSLTLLGMRRNWPIEEIEAIQTGLEDDLAAYMTTFYRKCFLGNKAALTRFSAQLQDDYLAELELAQLQAGLDYLASFTMPSLPPQLPLHLVHGKKDVVAPWDQQPELPQARHTLFANEGHFLSGFQLSC